MLKDILLVVGIVEIIATLLALIWLVRDRKIKDWDKIVGVLTIVVLPLVLAQAYFSVIRYIREDQNKFVRFKHTTTCSISDSKSFSHL